LYLEPLNLMSRTVHRGAIFLRVAARTRPQFCKKIIHGSCLCPGTQSGKHQTALIVTEGGSVASTRAASSAIKRHSKN
jgi:hypothetical protein